MIPTHIFWQRLLESREKQGRDDFDKDKYSLPFPEDEDPQDQDENEAYKKGWWDRRREVEKISK